MTALGPPPLHPSPLRPADGRAAVPPRGPRRVTPEAVLVAVVVGAVAVAVWPLLLAARGPQPVHLAPVVAHVAGMLAGYGVVVLIGLMSRAPVLERGVGSDRLARWHSRGGRAVVVLVVVHAWAAVVTWAQSRGEGTAAALWHTLQLPGLVAATVGTALLLAVGVVSARAARRRLRFEVWHTVHLLVYIGVALGFVHQLAGPDLAGHRVLQVLWALFYTQVFALVLYYRLLTPLYNASRHRLRVTAVQPEAAGVVSVVVEGRDLDHLQAEPGQFFRWRFLTPDLWRTAHPFSLSAPPTGTHLRLTVKALGDGSTNLQGVDPGTWVMAEGPYGAVTPHRRTHRDVLLVAGGVGITPLRALFESLPPAPGGEVLLLYRARTEADLIFREELDRIARRPGVRVQYLLGREVGPFTPELLHRSVRGLVHRDVFLCGPPGMAGAVRTALRQAGVPDAQVHEERFDL